MHILQSKHTRLKEKEILEILDKFNVSKAQLPKILSSDPALPEGCGVGDIIKIDRTDKDPDSDGKLQGSDMVYFRVVV